MPSSARQHAWQCLPCCPRGCCCCVPPAGPGLASWQRSAGDGRQPASPAPCAGMMGRSGRVFGQRISSHDRHNEWKLFVGQVPLEVRAVARAGVWAQGAGCWTVCPARGRGACRACASALSWQALCIDASARVSQSWVSQLAAPAALPARRTACAGKCCWGWGALALCMPECRPQAALRRNPCWPLGAVPTLRCAELLALRRPQSATWRRSSPHWASSSSCTCCATTMASRAAARSSPMRTGRRRSRPSPS